MSNITRRAFSRNRYRAPIIVSDSATDNAYPAEMQNSSVGGMYFESDIALQPGTGVNIQLLDQSPDPYWPEACNNYLAEVRWCRKIPGRDTPLYGIGARFIMDTCIYCGRKIEHKGVAEADICPCCLSRICSVTDGRIKSCIENYLMGNVI